MPSRNVADRHRVDPGLSEFTRTADKPGDMHLLRDRVRLAETGRNGGPRGTVRATWCGLEETLYGMGKGTFKATHNVKIVTCGECLVNRDSDEDNEDNEEKRDDES